MDENVAPPIDWQKEYPLLPLRDLVIFPGMVIPLFVGRRRSIEAVKAAMEGDRQVVVATQLDPAVDDPQTGEIYNVGCVVQISQVLNLPDGAIKALVEGKERARVKKYVGEDDRLIVAIERIRAKKAGGQREIETLYKAARSLFERYAKLSESITTEEVNSISMEENPDRFVDIISAGLSIKSIEKQRLLEAISTKERLDLLIETIQGEIEVQKIERKVRSRVKKQMEKSQRDYYLTERIKAIQKELQGVGDEEKTEFDEIKEKIIAANMPSEIEKKALKELTKLEQTAPMSAEGTVSRNYIDWLIDVPWSERTSDKIDIKAAAAILEDDHHGLEKVKERILEYLAVRSLVKKMKGPVLCFVGPPGVGKTSLGRSIAKAMGRKFVRFSLGGVRDEAEIRGHRRTYIGALPGRIIQSMKKAGVKNPVVMLDEIDKVSSDFRGDPASALLEALDPEQNVAFNDHYLEVDYDLSEVMFITTANVLHSIPRPLIDRMEVINISGYADQEKKTIARRFLIPKQEKEHGLTQGAMAINDKALGVVIKNYTRESGVRNLEREIAAICRKIARKIAENKSVTGSRKKKSGKVTITEKRLAGFLGEIRYRDDLAEKKSDTGVATGLAWTEVGGALLKVETSLLEGKGKFILTGKLGEVMKESARAAQSYIRSRREDFGLESGFHEKLDIHIHIPEGAIPKDGPSAGITLATSMVSSLLGVPVSRDVAMTGEITLRGRVLPVGGLKEKLLAAVRGGVKKALIPAENSRDLAEIPDSIRDKLVIIPVETMDDVLENALTRPFVRLEKKGPGRRSVKVQSNKRSKIAALSSGDETDSRQ